jgi:hypothetical protein
LEGKQASRESEQHAQDANVAEVNMVRRLMSNLRIPINIMLPTVAREAERIKLRGQRLLTEIMQSRVPLLISGGNRESFGLCIPNDKLSSRVIRHVKDSERHLS